ncbi:MAG: phosphatidylglycerol lysyltransferase domain-containing protein [Oscillospiraceae bacterium]|nr:phosphatidylglycerol lysyltransferase domain-containing protein [Oscillospiraceae bacterium]
MRRTRVQNHLANIGIALVISMSILIFIASFFPMARLHDIIFYAEISRFVQRIMSLTLLVIAWNLHMRKRFAWTLCIALLSGRLFLNLVLHHHVVSLIATIFEALALVILLISYSQFRRPSDRLSVKRSVFAAVAGLATVLTGAAIGRFSLSQHAGESPAFSDSLMETIGIIFGESADFPAYDRFILYFVWACAVASVILVLHSAIINKIKTDEERAKARELVLKYGQNSASYLVLENDKTLFFGEKVPGVAAYGVVGNVVTVCGDPVCKPEHFVQFLSEFSNFCLDCSYQCVFIGTTGTFLEQYEMMGYGHIKAGEEALFSLDGYGLAGGKMQKLRALITHASKEVTTHEYNPREAKCVQIEKEINEVSAAWLEGKKSGQLGFSVGGVNLDDPMDRRYFYARDKDGNIVAFNVFLPFNNFDGYLADVTRRVPHAPGGVTEKLVYDGFMAFRDEGAHWGSIGLATLANVREEGGKDDLTVKFLEFVYEKCNGFYGFKDLHHAKEKYNPTLWAPGYFVYSAKTITPEIAYAVVAIQNPGGIKDFLLSSVKAHFK